MTERPIIFSAEMVRAILDGRKTMTRRVIKPQPPESHEDPWLRKDGVWISTYNEPPHILVDYEIKCPYGKPGDALWCKEKWAWSGDESIPKTERIKNREVWYKADGIYTSPAINWRNPLFMPKWAARLWLKVMGIRVERVQDISGDDCYAEGLDDMDRGVIGAHALYGDIVEEYEPIQFVFKNLWDSINKKRGFGWDANPWVWVIEFERVDHDQNKEKTD